MAARTARARRRTYSIEASLSVLRDRFTPCGMRAGGRPLPGSRWSYSRKQRVLRVRVTARRVTLLARRGCE